MPNWGIDNWICDIYKPFSSCFLNNKMQMQNHVGNNSIRYKIDRGYKLKLVVEVNKSILAIESYLLNKKRQKYHNI